jgi:hypothetical protein
VIAELTASGPPRLNCRLIAGGKKCCLRSRIRRGLPNPRQIRRLASPPSSCALIRHFSLRRTASTQPPR